MKKSNRFSVLAGVAVLSLSTLSVWGSGTASAMSGVTHRAASSSTFTYWYPWGGASQTWDLWRIGVFQKENPSIKIHSVYVPTDSGISDGKLLASIAGGDPPSIGITDNYQAAYELAQQSAFAPMNQYLAQAHFNVNNLIPSFRSLMYQGSQIDLMPQDTNVNLLYYNKTMFKQAHLSPPTTLAQLDADAAKLTVISKNGKIDRMGFIPWGGAGASDPYLWGWIFGASFYNAKTHKLLLNDPHLTTMYNWIDSYAKKYNPDRIQSFMSGFGAAFSPTDEFYTGKVAMEVNGNWFAHALALYAPKVQYGVVPIPYPIGGRKDATDFSTNVWFLPKGGTDQAQAVKFMLFGSSGKILSSDINTWRSVAVNQSSHVGIKWYKGNVITDPVYKVVMEVADSPNSGSPGLTSVSEEMGNGLTSIMDNVIYHNQKVGPQLAALQSKLQPEIK